MRIQKVDVAVVGGGPAGLAAAIAASSGGAEKVTILDRNKTLGGILPQCIHNGFGLHRFKEDLTGPEYAQRFIDRVEELKIEVKLETMVLNIRPEKKILAINAKEGIFEIEAGSVVLAMGCRERSRGALSIPGTRPSGILTAGVAQQWINLEGYLPGKRIVILGSGDIGLIMARRLTLEGAEVKAVVEIMPYPGGLTRNVVQCLYDFDIPLFLEHTISFIHGKDRVEAVTIARVNEEKEFIPGTEKFIDCDTLLLSVGLIPENELSSSAGVRLDPFTGGPVVDERRQTSLEGIFACGNVVQVYDLVDHVSLEGDIAGKNAALYALGKLKQPKRLIKLIPGRNIHSLVPQLISGEDMTTIFVRVKTPEKSVKLKMGQGIKEVKKPLVNPNQTLTSTLSLKELVLLNALDEVEVSIIKEGRE